MQPPGGKQKLLVINESGLYSLILQSKLPTAQKFKRWVTHDVLPSVGKYGLYAAKEYLENPAFLLELANELRERMGTSDQTIGMGLDSFTPLLNKADAE